MNKVVPTLPSIRTRIVVSFVVFGTIVSLLSIVAVVVSTEAPAGGLILLLLAALIGFVGWQAATLLTHDIRVLARVVDETDPTSPSAHELPPASFVPSTKESAELAQALHRYSERIENLTGSLAGQVDGCGQEVSEATSTLSDFMYYVAHVLRTPVNAIRWSVESLKNEDAGNVTEEQREMLDRLESSVSKLASVAGELQDTLIVIRGEPLHMRHQPCDLAGLIDVAAGRMAVPLRRKQLSLSLHVPEKTLPAVTGDPDRLVQVLTILLDNAVQYTPAGHKVTVRANLVAGESSTELSRSLTIPIGVRKSVILSVEDQGIGISKQEQPKLFRAFFRGEQAREIWVDGKGVGLTLAKAIVEACGGQMWFVSHKGKGTAMRFSIPLTS